MEKDKDLEEKEEEIKKVGSDTNDSIAFYPKDNFAHSLSGQKKSKKTLYLVIILVLVIVFISFIFKRQIKNLFVGAPKPTSTSVSTPISTPTPTPNPLVRSEWSFEVLNGSTTSGLAKKISDKLVALGYPIVKSGNADKQNYSITQIFVKKGLIGKIDLVIADLKDTVKIASVAGELKEGTSSARIIIGKDSI